MKETICILPQKIGPGGPGSFQARLAEVLLSRGYKLNHDALDPTNKAILVIGGTRHINLLMRAKQNGVRIVQRLNGMNWVHLKKNTGLKHFLRAEVNNWILRSIRRMADQIVYQSEFTQNWWTRTCGKVQAPGRVIYNGVNLSEFTPLGAGILPAERFRILLVEGNLGNGYEGGLETAVELVKMLNRRQSKVSQLMVVGKVPDSLKKQYEDSGIELIWRGLVKREEIPAIDRSAHVLFSADVNAACPNSVIEALACGLPVIGFDTGALAELVTGESGAIAPYGSDPWLLQKPDIHALTDAAQQVLADYEKYRVRARARAELVFDIQHIADQYLEVLL